MKKQLLLMTALLGSVTLFSQVGINNDQPKATLDVTASSTDLTKTDGIIAPRLEGDELKNKNALYNEDQTGAIVYAKSASSGAGVAGDKTINIDSEGYYYFDGTVWVKFSGAASNIEPWQIQNTNDKAENNTENIYQEGKVAVGFNASDIVSDKQFEVKGDIRTTYTDPIDDYVYVFETAMDSGGQKYNANYVSDNEDINLSEQLSSLIVQKDGVVFVNWDKTGPVEYTAMMVNNTIIGGGGNSAGFTSSGSNGSHFAIGGSNVGQSVYANLQASTPDSEDKTVHVTLDASTGIIFRHRGDGFTNPGSYIFPISQPTKGQVLVGDGYLNTESRLEWKTLSDIAQESVKLKAPNGNCHKITVDNSGTLATEPVSCD